MNEIESIQKMLYSKQSKIQLDGDRYKITIKHFQENSNTSFYFKPHEHSGDVAQYSLSKNNICNNYTKDFAYIPTNISVISHAIKNNKLYGIIDKLSCCNGVVLFIMQRCHSNCIDVSIPLFFGVFCCCDSCKKFEKKLDNSLFKREIGSILKANSSPIRHFKKVMSPPS